MIAIEHLLGVVIKWGILFFEATGVVILIFTGVKAIVELLRRREDARLNLAQGVALALQFKIGGEVLRTVIAVSWDELGIIGATILLRAALTFLIHWEIKHMRKHADAETPGVSGEPEELVESAESEPIAS
jgi:uncharacterized membrane protein